MSPDQLARVFNSGARVLGKSSSTYSPANALGLALERMARECEIIAEEETPVDPDVSL
jgi:hypothetical protein